MEAFTHLTSLAAPLQRANIDTDIIIPMDRYLTAEREEMHAYAFETLRFLPNGAENPDFILNQTAFRGAKILVTGANFGCGSSRESAVWALHGLGIRCIIAPSFGNIFYNNCFQNGLLPITLNEPEFTQLLDQVDAAHARPFEINLERQQINSPDGEALAFDIDERRQTQLLQGLDDIGATLTRLTDIKTHRQNDERNRPWIYMTPDDPRV